MPGSSVGDDRRNVSLVAEPSPGSDMQAEKLAAVLAEFAERLVEGFHIQEILDHLVLRIVDVLPVTGAAVFSP